MRRIRALLTIFGAGVALTLGVASSAGAQDPGKWLLTGASSVPITYWQGLTSDPGDQNAYFVGIFEAPDDESATALALALSSLGNVRTTTMRAFDAAEMREIVAKAAG